MDERINQSINRTNQAISSVIASTLMAGGVTVFAGLDELPKVSLAVLAESLRAVILCLHAGQEKVLVNGEEVRVLHGWALARPKEKRRSYSN